jgi:hypothetical protein
MGGMDNVFIAFSKRGVGQQQCKQGPNHENDATGSLLMYEFLEGSDEAINLLSQG